MNRVAYRLAGLSAFVVVLAGCGDALDAFQGRPCPPPKGHAPADCRLAMYGTPDLSGQAFVALGRGQVTVWARFRGLAPNPAAGGRRDWPLIDSLAQPMGRLSAVPSGRMTLYDLAGRPYAVSAATLRGHGCAADPAQQRTHTLVQVVALGARASGTQGFLDVAALDRSTDSGRVAARTFAHQTGNGTGCGPARPERGPVRPLRDPDVDPVAHARLGGGEWNTVAEYDAKPDFGDVVYFSSNTTDVHVGGMTRGMVRVGTPVAVADRFDYCDPNSDDTLTWHYISIHTGGPRRMYGWIPALCPRALQHTG